MHEKLFDHTGSYSSLCSQHQMYSTACSDGTEETVAADSVILQTARRMLPGISV